MSLPAFACRRRVTVGMVAVTMLLFGAIGLSNLRVDLLPPLAFPTLTVRTEYVGAAPAEMELLITEPIEEVLGVVKNLRRISSVSRAGLSDVTLEFAWGTSMDQASIEVREKLELLNLPPEAGRPQLLRFDPSTEPVMRIALRHAGQEEVAPAELMAMRRFAEEIARRRLETAPGVAAVKIAGGLVEEIQVAFDPERLAQVGLSTAVIVERLRAENVNLAAGRLGEGAERYLLRTYNQFRDLEEIRALPLRSRGTELLRLGDVARVERGHREREAIIRLDGREAVEIAIYKEGDANTVATSQAVRDRLEALRAELPLGLALEVVDDQAAFIRAALAEVRQAAIFGGFLAIAVVGLFLRDRRATAIIAVSVPVSLAGAFFLMEQAGIGLNLMSLGGLALATGMVVDGSIVVLESISRRRSEGEVAPALAAEQGASRVAAAVTASVLTTIAVFLPLVFVEGVAGQLIRDQALTVSFAMLSSLFVALALIPMLAARVAEAPGLPEVTPEQPRGGLRSLARLPLTAIAAVLALLRRLLDLAGSFLNPIGLRFARLYERLSRGYLAVLPYALERKSWLLAVAALCFLLALAVMPLLGFDLVPQFAQDRFHLTVRLPPGTPLARTDALAAEIAARESGQAPIRAIYGVSGLGARLDANPVEAGENVARLLVMLDPGAGRRGEAEATERLREWLGARAGLELEFARPVLFDLARPLEVELVGQDPLAMRLAAERLIERLKATGRFTDLRSTSERGQPELRIEFDHERLASLGLTSRQVADQVVRAVRGEVATRLRSEDRRIDIVVRLPIERRASVHDLAQLLVNPESPRPVRLAAVARLTVDEAPAEIRRVNQQRVTVVAAQYRHRDLASAIAEVEAILAEPLAPGVSARAAGQSSELSASRQSLIFTLGLAVFLVYLVMAAQFESLLHPFVILLTVPLAVIGVVLSLLLAGLPLSAMAMIGLILLAGIVVNNAIVLIDRINQLRVGGIARRQAILQAAEERLRPILMTTLTTVIGFLPMALAGGEGAELRRPLAIAVVGGLALGTLLTLFVIPALYEALDRKEQAAFDRLRARPELGT